MRLKHNNYCKILEIKYEITKWHINKETLKNNTLNFKNDFVGVDRSILIHTGNTP